MAPRIISWTKSGAFVNYCADAACCVWLKGDFSRSGKTSAGRSMGDLRLYRPALMGGMGIQMKQTGLNVRHTSTLGRSISVARQQFVCRFTSERMGYLKDKYHDCNGITPETGFKYISKRFWIFICLIKDIVNEGAYCLNPKIACLTSAGPKNLPQSTWRFQLMSKFSKEMCN